MRRPLWWIILLLILAGCQSVSYSANCNNRTDEDISRCDIHLSQLSGQWSRDLNVALIAGEAAALPLTATVSVGQGSVRLSYTNAQGDAVSHEVSPDAPLELSDTIQVRGDQARVEFTALNLSVSDVQAVIEVGPAPD